MKKSTFSIVIALFVLLEASATLRISEICPRPSQPDSNGKESGWIELVNTGDEEINLSDYALVRWNRGKENKKKNRKRFVSRSLKAGERTVVYTSEAYPNYRIGEKAADYGGMMVFPFKINPKKYPNVALYRWNSASDEPGECIETFIVPVDLPDDMSFGPGSALREISVINGKTPYEYRTGEGEMKPASGRLTMAEFSDIADLSSLETPVASTAVEPGVNASVNLKDTIDAHGVVQTSAYDFSALTAANRGLKVVPSLYPQDNYTVSFYFRSTPSPSASGDSSNIGMPLFESRPSNTGDRRGIIAFLNDGGQITIQPRSSSNSVTYQSDTVDDYTDGNWHHFVLVAGQVAGEMLTLYIDGKPVFQGVMPFDCHLQKTIPYCFGHAYDSSYWRLFNGQIADIRIFNRALSAAQIGYLSDENKAKRDVTLQYGELSVKTDSHAASAVEYDKSSDVFEFKVNGAANQSDYSSTQAYIENIGRNADALCPSGETISFWLNPSSFAAKGEEAVALLDCRNGGNGAEGYLLLYGTDPSRSSYGKFYLQRASAVDRIFNVDSPLTIGSWTHVALTIDANTKEAVLHLNGVKSASATLDNYYPAVVSRRFGGTHDSYWRGYRGKISGIKIYSGVLPSREIAKMHNSSPFCAQKVTENLFTDAIGVEELRPVNGLVNVALPKHNGQANIVFEAPGLVGGLKLEMGGQTVPLNERIPLADGVESIAVKWELSPEESSGKVISLQLEARLQAYAEGVSRAIFPEPTFNEANDFTLARPYGPNIGPSNDTVFEDYGFYLPQPMAASGEDFKVVFDIHPISDDEMNAIDKVELMYRCGFGEVRYREAQLTEDAYVRVVEEKDDDGNKIKTVKTSQGYVGVIPAEEIPSPGRLIQFGARITDKAGAVWVSPSRNNPDDCPNWYGTIAAPLSSQVSQNLQTFHLFVEGDSLELMDKDYDAVKGAYPLGARCGIYDGQTDTYYDNVRIDLRGNTTAKFVKKSHGLRFSKCQPLTCRNMMEGGSKGVKLEEIRKTSFIAEYADPTFIRQALSFYVWRNAGNKVPFDYPVRLNLNGEFYQLAFHSNRFTDELIEDYYGFDPNGYSYKNVGTISPNVHTTAGDVEKKTPDDGDETSSAAYGPLVEFASKFSTANSKPRNDPSITAAVYDHFDIPAWINYLATARITQEADDIWANICLYWDKNGNGVWMPLAYDHNLSWGQYYYGDDTSRGRIGLRPDDDSFKSHPFYGGWTVRAHKGGSLKGATVGDGNYAVEAIWQNSDFRAMYLRRLRSLMDQILKAPGTSQAETPFWDGYVKNFKEKVAADASVDRLKWGDSYKSTSIYVWSNVLNWDEAYDDLWENYIEKRRNHLFVKHCVSNTSWEIGYASDLNAGIPLAHKARFAPIVIEKIEGAVKLTNPNVDSIDLSNWTIEGILDASSLPEDSEDAFTLPPGTVLLGGKSLFLAYDRKDFVLRNEPCFVIGMAVYADDAVWVPRANAESETAVLKSPDGNTAMEGLLSENIANWLNTAISHGRFTAESLSGVTAAADYKVAYDIDEMPVAGISKDTVLDIAGFAVDSNGNVSIKVSLRAGGSLKNGRINGTVRLFSSSSLSGPWIECAAKGNAFSSGELLINHEVGGVKSSSPCFFRVRITENSDE